MTTNLKDLNGYLLSKDKVLAEIHQGELYVNGYDIQMLPFLLQRTRNLEKWLSERAIDSHRTNSRLLKKALRLEKTDDVSTVLSVNAATITDTYWIKDKNSKLTYEDIRFKQNPFADLALLGNFSAFGEAYVRTPELTNIGSFEKCWKFEDNEWWMYKLGTAHEKFSELLVYQIASALNLDVAYYEKRDNYICTKDFTNNASVIYEPLSGIVGDKEDYNYVFEKLYEINPKLAKEYLDIIWLDSVVFNADRHTNNMGIIRSVESGNILKMAPNFDNNLSLISRDIQFDKISRKNDFFIGLFVELIKENKNALKMVDEMNLSPITPVMLDRCIAENNFWVQQDAKDFAKNFILNGQKELANEVLIIAKKENIIKLDTSKSLKDVLKQSETMLSQTPKSPSQNQEDIER